MGRPKEIKPKVDRLTEGISILKQLRDGGVKEHALGYLELKDRISEWVNGQDSWEGKKSTSVSMDVSLKSTYLNTQIAPLVLILILKKPSRCGKFS